MEEGLLARVVATVAMPMSSAMSATATTSRIQSLVRRRYGSSDAGPNARPRHSAIRLAVLIWPSPYRRVSSGSFL